MVKDLALQHVSSLSGPLATAQAEDNVDEMAAIVVAARALECKALAALAGRVSEPELEAAQAAAFVELGW